MLASISSLLFHTLAGYMCSSRCWKTEIMVWISKENLSTLTQDISPDQISGRFFFQIVPLKNEQKPDLQQQMLKLVTSDLSITLKPLQASWRSNGGRLWQTLGSGSLLYWFCQQLYLEHYLMPSLFKRHVVKDTERNLFILTSGFFFFLLAVGRVMSAEQLWKEMYFQRECSQAE